MRVRLTVLGTPDGASGAADVELQGGTLAELRETLAREGRLQETAEPLAFVNGGAVDRDWEEVSLSDGDEVLFVVPVSGG